MLTLDVLSAAMERGEFFVEYLPVVALRDERCIGAEALLRWRRGSEVLQPIDFLYAVLNTPFSGRLTYWVIDAVAAEFGDWLGDHPRAQISINVPAEILGRGGLEYAALRSGLHARADQIVLEVTEHGVPDRLGLEALDAMAARGVRVALDDVALSGVNLALLTRCNYAFIKLDRHLVAQLSASKAAPPWLAALGSLLQKGCIHVIAEGVESRYQANVLLEAGVQMAQGFLFSSPLSARALKRYYALTNRMN